MKTVRICYTILDVIEVPDEMTDEEIQEFCEQNFYEVEMNYNDVEWEVE